jgi:protein phosphatase
MSIVEFAMRSDVGLVRDENQDTAGAFPANAFDDTRFPGLLFVVADGMGGHRGGKEASTIAVRSLTDHFFSTTEGSTAERLRDAFLRANATVRGFGEAHPEHRGLGTTLTALSLCRGIACIAHVGDSRAYRVAGGTLEQLTEDHSVVHEWLRKGWIDKEQARFHPERSLLYRALGVGAELAVDVTGEMPVQGGDRFVLCSDGLTNHVGDAEILEIVSSRPPQEACGELVDLALKRGGSDNVTVQVVRLLDEEK